jgi:patatin-like phospholipase/acyl hydrolase
MSTQKPFFGVLAIDGGGIRGIIPASVLVTLEKWAGAPLSQVFDLIVGTSTGGLISLGITHPDANGNPAFTAQDVLGFYTNQDNDALIFTRWLDIPFHTKGEPVGWEWALTNPKYQGTGVQQFLADNFGSARLSGALAPVACVSYQISGDLQQGLPAPYVFRSWEQPDFYTVDVGRATSAAPLYFPPHTLGSVDGSFTGTFVDGGVCANDPALVGFAEAASLLSSQGKNIEDYNVWVLSIGTGQASLTIDPGDGGIYGWLASDALPNVLLNGPAQITDSISGALFQPADGLFYGRVQVPLQGVVASTGTPYSAAPELDNWTEDNIQQLLLAGEAAGGAQVVAATIRQLAGRVRAAAPQVSAS